MTYSTLLTDVGHAALAQAHATQTPLVFSHLVVGDGVHANIAESVGLTALLHEVHRTPAGRVYIDAEHPTWVVIEAAIPADVGGWTVREIGLICNGQLLAIGKFPETYKPVISDGAGRDMVIRMIIETNNAGDVSLVIDPSVAVASTQSVLDAIGSHEAKPDPHPQYLTHAEGDDRFVPLAQRAAAGGVATLGADGLVPLSQLPPAIASDAELAASLAAHVTEPDPHPQYLTAAELQSVLRQQRARRHFFANQ